MNPVARARRRVFWGMVAVSLVSYASGFFAAWTIHP